MSFRQQLARRYVNIQQAYQAETQQMLQAWRAETKPKFIQACEAAADRRLCFCEMTVEVPDHLQQRFLQDRLLRDDFLAQQLQESLIELGFPEGRVKQCKVYDRELEEWEFKPKFTMAVRWSPEDATGTIAEPQHTQSSRGFCTTCPICQEHRPAVVLVPCGHVICGDCHRRGQLRQCPFCRRAITSATDGLFMD